MSDTDYKIPESLEKALKAGQVIPFVGAGVSRAVEKKDKNPTKTFDPLFPSWKEYVEILAETLTKEGKPNEATLVNALVNSAKPKYLEAMQHAFEELGASLWYEKLNEYFKIDESKADENTLELPRLIWKLGSNVVFTTNIDKVLEWKSVNSSTIEILDTQKVESAELQRETNPSPTIIYLHGRVGDKEHIVFTREQYDNFYKNQGNEAKLRTLQAFLTTKSFLFIGFSLDDSYFVEQLNNIHDIYKGGASQYFALIKKSDAGKLSHLSFVKEVYFEDFGEPLLKVLREMRDIANTTNNIKEAEEPSPISPHNPTKVHFNVPFASKGDAFVGREGLREKIWESLDKGRRTAIGQAINIKGIGGLGKTQLAVEYANDYRDKYENGVFWITADEDIDIQLIKIGEELNWISQFDKGFDQAELVRNRFRKLSDCLIIFDNLVDQETIKNYLPVGDARPHILVTSQKEQNGFYPINLDILSRDEARQLLTEIAEREAETESEKEAVENILTELDGLPLAVELVGGYLFRRKNISFQDYFQYLEKEPLERLEKRFPNESFTHHDKSIIRTLKISEELLDETRYLEEILDILAWSGKSSMGYSLLRELVETDDFALNDALGVALELHFIKQEEKVERYAIHRLLARVRQFERPLKEHKEWHRKIVKRLEKWFRDKEDESKTLSEAEPEFDHLETWQRRMLKYIPTEAVWLTLLKADPLIVRGNYQEAQKYTKEAFDLYYKEKLNDKLLLIDLYISFNQISTELGDYRQAKSFIENALNLYNENLVNDKKLFVNLLAALGSNYSNLGIYDKALELKQKVFEMERELFGEKHYYIANSLNNLGSSYSELGNYKKALDFQQQGSKMTQELFGEKHSYMASSLSNLGLTYSQLNDHEKALELQQQAFEMRLELFGDKHPDIANSLNNLSYTYGDLNNHEKALELHQQAFEMRLELFGDKHPDIATSLNNLGYTYGELGNYQKALELHQQALEIRQELFGDKHPDVAASLNNLGWVYSDLGNHQKSFEFYEKALQIQQEMLGNQHPDTILYCKNLIVALVDNGYREKAGRLAGKFLSYVPQNSQVRSIFERYGAVYRKAKQKKKKRR